MYIGKAFNEGISKHSYRMFAIDDALRLDNQNTAYEFRIDESHSGWAFLVGENVFVAEQFEASPDGDRSPFSIVTLEVFKKNDIEFGCKFLKSCDLVALPTDMDEFVWFKILSTHEEDNENAYGKDVTDLRFGRTWHLDKVALDRMNSRGIIINKVEELKKTSREHKLESLIPLRRLIDRTQPSGFQKISNEDFFMKDLITNSGFQAWLTSRSAEEVAQLILKLVGLGNEN